jgi:hypothetical protein
VAFGIRGRDGSDIAFITIDKQCQVVNQPSRWGVLQEIEPEKKKEGE